ncbi:uncharacterized protein LOC123987922 [Osmia bicornis bicornis]|uniref:uncharacterized protein LOC123987922 n=1 Tax=Osmia bicornis bicornis TaxID=1437191 RepID=UPI001EAEBC5B|nr:uncharacterized protein LOC123987922 [Osmia bicornis bicornis]XP_046142222.1 uncharacterized protein LOC123987922 [Osmia bicornis bicornis]
MEISGMFNNSKLYQMVRDNSLRSPASIELPGRQVKVPYFIAADSAFALQENIMKPYGGKHRKSSCKRVFNYRLSRARRVVENAFGIISSVFGVLRKPLLLEPEKAQIVVTTILCLHNYLRQHSKTLYTPHGAVDYEDENGKQMDGSWRNDPDKMNSMLSLQRKPRRSATALEKIRDELADYYSHEGAFPWQNKYA